MMTKQQFEAVASTLAPINHSFGETDWDKGYNAAMRATAERLANLFAHENPRFDRAKFLTACGF